MPRREPRTAGDGPAPSPWAHDEARTSTTSPLSDARAVLYRALRARFLSLPIQAFATAMATYITVRALGVTAYATVGLLVGLQAFGNVITLGGPGAVSTASASMSDRSNVLRTVVAALRVMLLSSGAILLLALTVSIGGLWPSILGGRESNLLTEGALVAVVGTAVAQIAAVPATMLIASGRAPAAIWSLSLGSLLYLVGTALLWISNGPAVGYVATPFLGQIAGGLIASRILFRCHRFSMSHALGLSVCRSFNSRRIRGEAVPVLVMWIALPIAYQTDRLLLAHLSSPVQLATYNIVSQLFNPVLGAVTLAASSLWGHFAARRQAAQLMDSRSVTSLSVQLGVFGALLGSVFVILAPVATTVISNHQILVGRSLCMIFGFFLLVQAFHQPSAMLQTDRYGLRFNAVAVVIMTIANVVIGIILTPRMGAAGPIVASVVSLTLFLALPSFLRAVRVTSR